MLLTAPAPSFYDTHSQCDYNITEDMIMNNSSTNPQDHQGDGEWGDSRHTRAFLASLLGPIQTETSSNTDNPSSNINPSVCVSSSASDPTQGMLLGRFDSQNLQDTGGFEGGVASLQNQQSDSIPRLFNQPKTNADQVFGMNSSAAASEFRAFFASGNVPDLGGSMQSSSNSQGLSLPSNRLQANLSGSGGITSGAIQSLSGDLPVQSMRNFNRSSISSTAQHTQRSQVSLRNALNSTWQQQHQSLQLQQQLQHHPSSSLQHLHIQQQLQQQQPLNFSLQHQEQVNEAVWPGNDVASLECPPPQLPPEIKWKGRGRSSTFPLKLHQMLLDLEQQEGGTAIASFLPHGRGFQIHKPKEFSKEIMPNYFRMSTYSSFQRQLNLYDFQRIAEGPEKGAYWHELFLRENPMLSTNMKRSKVKGATRARQDERLRNYELQKGKDRRFGN